MGEPESEFVRVASMSSARVGPGAISGSAAARAEPDAGRIITVAQALRDAAARLAESSDTARLDAELLMAHVLGCERSAMLLGARDRAAPEGFAALVERRRALEPVSQIIGQAGFYGRTFRVTRDVLSPRADSECVVEALLDTMLPHARLLDCGTGTGALLLTALAERPVATGVGIDASEAALSVARANAAALNLADRAQFDRRDWRESGWAANLGRFDAIIANPPYVEDGDAALAPDVAQWEPGLALYGGADGLDAYRCLIPQLDALLAKGGAAVLEIGATQGDAVAALARQAGFATGRRRDLSERERALVLTRDEK